MKIQVETNPASGAIPARVERAAKQFEGMLINQLLAPIAEQHDEGEDGAASQVRQTAVQALSTAISQAGGIGIAHMLVRQLQAKQ
jgi:Rod binding domain-containing protein